MKRPKQCPTCADLRAAANATLLFHGSVWSAETRELWKQLTGEDEATTKTLCDFVRKCLDYD